MRPRLVTLVLCLGVATAITLGACGGDDDSSSGADANTSCSGCLDDNGDCVDGTSAAACGIGGASCSTCDSGQVCDGEAGMCVAPPACSPATCDGCCDGDTCVTGTSDSTCGSGGLACDDCGASGASCESQVCELPCGPDTCAGCCDGNTCVEGDSDAACGWGGQSCQSCGADSCSFGTCVSASCSETCGGCCSGDTCLGGDSAPACGAGGDACLDCGPNRLCEAGGCVVDPTSRWQIVALSATVPQFDDQLDPWDSFGGLPDPFFRVTVGGISEPETTGDSSSDSNTLSPYWNDIVIQDMPARTLFDDFELAVLDDDVNFSDTIGSCDFPLTDDSTWFDGGVITVTCGDATVRFRIRAQ